MQRSIIISAHPVQTGSLLAEGGRCSLGAFDEAHRYDAGRQARVEVFAIQAVQLDQQSTGYGARSGALREIKAVLLHDGVVGILEAALDLKNVQVRLLISGNNGGEIVGLELNALLVNQIHKDLQKLGALFIGLVGEDRAARGDLGWKAERAIEAGTGEPGSRMQEAGSMRAEDTFVLIFEQRDQLVRGGLAPLSDLKSLRAEV